MVTMTNKQYAEHMSGLPKIYVKISLDVQKDPTTSEDKIGLEYIIKRSLIKTLKSISIIIPLCRNRLLSAVSLITRISCKDITNRVSFLAKLNTIYRWR